MDGADVAYRSAVELSGAIAEREIASSGRKVPSDQPVVMPVRASQVTSL